MCVETQRAQPKSLNCKVCSPYQLLCFQKRLSHRKKSTKFIGPILSSWHKKTQSHQCTAGFWAVKKDAFKVKLSVRHKVNDNITTKTQPPGLLGDCQRSSEKIKPFLINTGFQGNHIHHEDKVCELHYSCQKRLSHLKINT